MSMTGRQHDSENTPARGGDSIAQDSQPAPASTGSQSGSNSGLTSGPASAPGPGSRATGSGLEAEAALWRRRLAGWMGQPFRGGNRIEPLRNGREIFPPMLQAIEEAERSIEFLTYVYWSGEIAERFATALAEAAGRGVQVRVLLDGFGAKPMPEACLDQLRDGGVEVRWFRPLKLAKLWRLDNRTHRKVLVVDGRIGFTGGVGIAQEWEGDARDTSEWRDNHFRLQGPAVDALRAAFVGNWCDAGGALDPRLVFPEAETPGESEILPLRATGGPGWSDIATVVRVLVQEAQQRLWLSSPYFLPDAQIREGLCAAARRGVDVQVMVPGHYGDMRLAGMAYVSECECLVEAGVKVWLYQRTMLHIKQLLVDDTLSLLGSANINQRSLSKDDEMAMCVIDPTLQSRLARDFEDDRGHCEAFDLERWRRRSWLRRLVEAIVKRFRPQL